MDRIAVTVVAIEPDAEGARDLSQLALDVLPFAHPQEVQEFGLAQPAKSARRQFLLLLAQVVPQVEVGEEVRLLVGEASVAVVGRLLVFERSLAWVLDRQRGRNDDDLAHAALLGGLQDHAADPGVDGQLREPAAKGCQPRSRIGFRLLERPEFFEQLDAVVDLSPVGRLDERESGEIAEAQRGHLQDDGRQVRAQDLGIGELRPRREVRFGVEPDADPV